MTVETEPSATRPQPGLNRRLKSWPGWIVMLFVVVALLVVGATRSSGPQSQEDRVDDITRRIACPVCDGESVFESQNNASRSLRNQVEDLVRDNELDDSQILAVVDGSTQAELLLVPKSSGLDSLVWVLPAVGLVVGVVGLTLAFRRWRLEAAGIGDPTAADEAIVAAALAADDDVGDSGDDSVGDEWPDPDDVADQPLTDDSDEESG